MAKRSQRVSKRVFQGSLGSGVLLRSQLGWVSSVAPNKKKKKKEKAELEGKWEVQEGLKEVKMNERKQSQTK
jgi:hypothetical protein